MKITLDCVKLNNCFSYLTRIIKKSEGSTPAGKNVQFLFTKNNLYLYAGDTRHFCEVLYGPIEITEVSYCFDFNLIEKIVRLASTKEVILEFKDTAVVIQEGKSEYTIQFAKIEDVSYLFRNTQMLANPIFTVSLKEFKTMVTFLSGCLPGVTTANFRGIYFDGSAGSFVSTNLHAIAYYPVEKYSKSDIFMSIESCELVAGIAQKDEDVSVFLVDSLFIATIGNAKYILRSITNKFPKYKVILTRLDKHKYKVAVNKDSFVKIGKKLIPFTDALHMHSVIFRFTKDSLQIEGRGEGQQGKECLDVKTEGIEETVEFPTNFLHVVEYLRHTTSAEIIFTFGDTVTEFALLDNKAFYLTNTLT